MTDHVATRRPSNFPALWSHEKDFQANTLGYPNVGTFVAAATLLIGDAVYLTSSITAQKSATNNDYATFIGIVVGGESFGAGSEAAFDTGLVGTTAALVNQYVYVAGIGSIVYAVAGAAITAGARVGISATSGRIDDIATGNLFGVAMEAASTTGDHVKILVTPLFNIGAGSGTVTGTGTAGTLAKFTAAGVIGDSDFVTQTAVATAGAAPAGGTGATAGAYDTSAHRDALITLVNDMRTALIAVGILS